MRFSLLISCCSAIKFGVLNDIHLNINLDLAEEKKIMRQNVEQIPLDEKHLFSHFALNYTKDVDYLFSLKQKFEREHPGFDN